MQSSGEAEAGAVNEHKKTRGEIAICLAKTERQILRELLLKPFETFDKNTPDGALHCGSWRGNRMSKTSKRAIGALFIGSTEGCAANKGSKVRFLREKFNSL